MSQIKRFEQNHGFFIWYAVLLSEVLQIDYLGRPTQDRET